MVLWMELAHVETRAWEQGRGINLLVTLQDGGEPYGHLVQFELDVAGTPHLLDTWDAECLGRQLGIAEDLLADTFLVRHRAWRLLQEEDI